MKNFYKIIFFSLLLSTDIFANPGDTTWVTVYNKKWLDHYGNYDTTATFPTNKRFRKIRLHYILGRYSCPGNPQYCGSWDYTTQIYSRHANMDSVEIARVITPYATDWFGKNKTHDYIIDVADYATALDGTTGIRFNYSGYSWGFTITLKLEFIEGIPPMDELAVKNIYDGYYPFGNATNSIENYLTAKIFSYGSSVNKSFIKNTVSGHGADANDCAEFCSKYYQQKINGNVISQKQLWRKDCGANEVYPQTGTWIYERANWCPGAVVWPIYHDISSVTNANTNFTVDADMQTYTVTSPSAGFNWVSQLITYGAPNHTLDVSIEDIVSPSKDPNYARENPACSTPVIKIKNVGTNTVSSVVFSYGLQGTTPLTHTWTGNLKFLDTALVTLPPSTIIMTSTVANNFSVAIVKVNGTTDQNNFNNTYQSVFTPVISYPDTLVVKFFTNKSTDVITGFNESSWALYNYSGSVIASRNSCVNSKLFIDTVVLKPGCYKFVISDSGCDGLEFWNNSAAGAGSCRFEKMNAGGSAFYNFPKDIGCGFTKYFTVQQQPNTNLVGIEKIQLKNTVEVYPNPASNQVYVKFDLIKSQKINYTLTDVTGKIIFKNNLDKFIGGYKTIDITGIENGVYFITTVLEDNTSTTNKILIQH